MGEIFRGWKRKFGGIMLVMACAFMAMWVRSQFIFEDLEIPLGDTVYAYGISSKGGGIEFDRFLGRSLPGDWIYSSWPAPLDENGQPDSATPWEPQHEIEWRWDWAGFHFGAAHWKKMNWRIDVCMIPYWSIVLPLTLCSVWFLLSKPRKAKLANASATET